MDYRPAVGPLDGIVAAYAAGDDFAALQAGLLVVALNGTPKHNRAIVAVFEGMARKAREEYASDLSSPLANSVEPSP